MTVHDNVEVTKEALRILDDERFTFYLLVDKKSRYMPSDFIPELRYSTVRVLMPMVMNWAGYSLIEGELRLIEEALKDEPRYLHYLSGADMPLKKPDQIDSFFSQGGIFINVRPKPDEFAHYKVLCKHYFVDCKYFRRNKFVKVINHLIAHLQKPFMKRKKCYGEMYAGSALWSIPLDFAQYVMENKTRIQNMYRYSLAADEVFMQTLLMNSAYKNQLSQYGNARLIDWKNREGNSPKTFTMDDASELLSAVANPQLMFIRKIHASRDENVGAFLSNAVKNT